MNRKLFFISALVVGGTTMQPANALELSFSPQSQSVAVGGTVSVDAVLSGLQSADEILSAFDVSVDFNSSILGFSSGSLGVNFGALSWSDAPSLSGSTISWDLTSNELDSFLQNIQGDSVTLGTLVFNALNIGSSALTYSYSDLTGRNSQALSYSAVNGNITVIGEDQNGNVPEPTTWMLIILGALGLVGLKQRKAKLPGVFSVSAEF